MQRNLTSGSVPKTLLYFSLPYLLSYFLQTLYGLADLFIIGQFNSVDSTTAVSVGSQVMHMVTVVIVGLAMGATVMIGRSVGADDRRQTAAYVGNTVTLFMAVSVLLTLALLALLNPIVSAVSTPPEAVNETVSYLTICFIGIPFITAYNIISSIFRGLGDSKSPMYFIAVACGVNIALDYLFIGVFDMGAAGAALGTTAAQAVSVMVALVVILLKKTGIRLSKNDFIPQKRLMANLIKIGIPIALQDGCIQISFLVITAIANGRGLYDAAAVGIVEKIIGILFLIPSSMLSAISALAAQNVGADKHDRARMTLRFGILICTVWGAAMVILMQFLSGFFVGWFTDKTEVVKLGSQYMKGYVLDCLLAGIHFCFSGYFCAYGKSSYSFIHNIVSITLARIPLAYLASVSFPNTLFPMGLATCTGSAVSIIICLIFYFRMKNLIQISKKK